MSVVIRRPVEEVFDYMNDVAREPEWQPQLVEAEQTPAGPTTVGTRRRYVSEFMGRRVENTYVVRAYEPNVRVVLETTPESALEASSEVSWAEVEAGTEVTMAVDGRPRGALGVVPRRLLERTFEKGLVQTLDRLKRVLEASG